MKGHLWTSGIRMMLVMLVVLFPPASAMADDHGSGQHTRGDSVTVGAVVVREVQVRDVQVPRPRPSVSPRPEVPRPMLPDYISRPNQSPYPQSYDGAQPARGRRSYYNRPPKVSGLVGYPTGYPYAVVYPFVYEPPVYYEPYSPPAPNTYSNAESVTAGARSIAALDCGVDPIAPAPCGGVSFAVSPANAQVSVEGVYVGTVDGFSPSRPPLVLAPGLHYIEVRLPGYRTATFEVTIGAGEVTTYQGAMEPLRTR